MTGRHLIRLLAGAALPACASTSVDAWPVGPRNPTSATFGIPIEDARVLVLDAFCLRSMVPDNIWGIMAEPEEGQDFRLQRKFGALGDPYYSPVYHSPRGPLIMTAGFRIRISAPQPGRTTVEVIAVGTQVVAGHTVGHLGFLTPHGSHWIMKRVAPTTVEEHAILRRCAKAFGVPDFPNTIVPASGVEGIVDILVNDDDTFDQMGAHATLVFLDAPAATDPLVAALERGGRGGARAAAALGDLHATAALPALQRAAASGDFFLRDGASDAIRAMRPPKDPSTDDLVAKLESRSLACRFEAALALEGAGKELDRTRPVLESFLGSDIPSERWRAAAALVRIRRAAERG